MKGERRHSPLAKHISVLAEYLSDDRDVTFASHGMRQLHRIALTSTAVPTKMVNHYCELDANIWIFFWNIHEK
jgi:hypothetical protein